MVFKCRLLLIIYLPNKISIFEFIWAADIDLGNL